MKIGDVPRNVQRRDLSDAVGGLAEAAHHTLNDEAAMIHTFANAHKIVVGTDLTRPSWKAKDCLTLRIRKD
jgi:hypothetical protein